MQIIQKCRDLRINLGRRSPSICRDLRINLGKRSPYICEMFTPDSISCVGVTNLAPTNTSRIQELM